MMRIRRYCAGGLAAIDLVVELLARGCGRTCALKGLADMLVDETHSSQRQLKSRVATGSGMGPVDRAIALMRLWMASDRCIEQLAEGVDISRRQLDRLFRANHGVTASEYWAEMRLRHAQWRLLNLLQS